MELQYLENLTPFEWFTFEKMAPRRALYDIVIVKAALPMAARFEQVITAPERAQGVAIEMADRTRQSELGAYAALAVASDTVLGKPATDVILSGHAKPKSPQTREWPAQITIQTATKTVVQSLALQGLRHWKHSFTKGWHLSQSEAVAEPLPMHYELAYGGSYMQKDQWEHHAVNPVGRGHFPAWRLDKDVYYPAAQIELLKDRLTAIDRPISIPALGSISRVWDARTQFAGT